MIRTTTPTHVFQLNEPLSFEAIQLTYKQEGDIILVKTEDDCTIDGNTISVTLTQEETKKFSAGIAYAQIKAIDNSGNVIATNPVAIHVQEVLNEVLL